MKKFYLLFSRATVSALALSFILGVLPLVTKSQQSTTMLALVEFMKVKPENVNRYLEMEKNIWKPIHQERVEKGKIMGWILYGIRYKGANDEYNFATVTIFDNGANLENPYSGIDFAKVHPGKEMDKVFAETLLSRDLVKSRLISMIDFAYPEGTSGPAPHKYIVVNYMKSEPGSDFVNLERTLAKPVSQVLVNSGEWAGWSLWGSVFPRGTDQAYDYITVDNYAEFSKLGTLNYRNAYTKAHPDKEWSEFTGKIGSSRKMVLSELWEITDMALREQ